MNVNDRSSAMPPYGAGEPPLRHGAKKTKDRAAGAPDTFDPVTYARRYVKLQAHYNRDGALADSSWADKAQGRSPFWDVDEDVARAGAGVELLGEPGPFRRPNGQVRIYAHYLNTTEIDRWRSVFQEPTGWVEAAMTSSFRTLLLFPEGEQPFMLKFDGRESTPSGAASRALTQEAAEVSVRNSEYLREFPFIVPEPSALCSARLGAFAIHRPLPLPTVRPPQEGDQLVTWHVLSSKKFARSEEGRALFGDDPDGWFARELAPKVADLIYDSFTRSFGHLVMHSQNIDVVVDRAGHVVQLLVKDLNDVAHDLAAQVVLGQPPRDLPPSHQVLAGNQTSVVDDSEASFYQWYNDFFSPLGLENRDALRFQVPIIEALKARVAKELGPKVVDQYPEAAAIYRAPSYEQRPYEQLGLLRPLYLKAKLVHRFRPDPSARASFERPGGILVSSTRRAALAFQADELGLVYGFVDQTPVALRIIDGVAPGLPMGARLPRVIGEFFFRFD